MLSSPDRTGPVTGGMAGGRPEATRTFQLDPTNVHGLGNEVVSARLYGAQSILSRNSAP